MKTLKFKLMRGKETLVETEIFHNLNARGIVIKKISYNGGEVVNNDERIFSYVSYEKNVKEEFMNYVTRLCGKNGFRLEVEGNI